jgi:hypothetical protein
VSAAESGAFDADTARLVSLLTSLTPAQRDLLLAIFKAQSPDRPG